MAIEAKTEGDVKANEGIGVTGFSLVPVLQIYGVSAADRASHEGCRCVTTLLVTGG